MSPSDQHPHDKLFRRTFGNPRHAEGVFRTLLPAELVGRIDWTALRPEEGTYVDEKLKQRQSDVLFSVPLGGRTALLYLLFEHQSSVDPLMALRMVRYLVRIWDRWLEQQKNQKATVLPPVIPLVLYHGNRRWSAATELREVIDIDPADAASFEPYLPRLRFLLDDLTVLSEKELRDRRALSTMARLAQALLRALRHERAVRLLLRWLDHLRELEQDPGGLSDFRTVVYYLWEAGKPGEWNEVETFMQENTREKTGIEVRCIADVYRAQGWAKGREEGREEGRDAGRVEEARHAVLAVFETREMAIPKNARDRIAACNDLNVLAVWLRRAVKAESPEQIFDQ